MIIYLGSTRPGKVDGTREALAAIARVDSRFRSSEIRSIDLGAVGPRMPMTEQAIIAGAVGRARALVTQVTDRNPGEPAYFIGLEGGLDPIAFEGGHTGFALKSWACVTDSRRWGYGAGGAVVLPDGLAAAVTEGRELGEVIDALAGAPTRGTRGAWGVLTRDLITRRDAFRVAVISAFAPFLNPGLYDAE